MPRITRITLYHVIALTVSLVWSTTFVATKTLLNAGMEPATIFLYRFAIAYFGLLAVCHRDFKALTAYDEFLFLLAGITGGSLYFWTENTALGLTYASNVSIIISVTPLLTMGLTALWLRRTLSPAMVFGSAVALAGVALVVVGSGGEVGISPAGDFLTFSAALCWAVYSVLMKVLGTRGYDSLMVTRKVFFYGLLTMAVYFPFSGCSLSFGILHETRVWGNILFLGVVASLLCYAVWNKVLEVLGPDKATNYIYLSPVGAVTTAVIILHEPLTLSLVVGGAVAVLGVIVVERAKPITSD